MASNNPTRTRPSPPPRPLPVARPRAIRRSAAGPWRAAVLIAVHVVAAVHIGHWLATGSTITPVEPSEAMQFTKEGVINAGLIFFALAILSTLVLGRWFCGWGCHLVALQDLARWLLARARIRPRPIRSRVLGMVPLLAFLYMFIAPLLGPLADRIASAITRQPPVGLTLWSQTSTHFLTSDFWGTFPGWLSATLTFLVCGFLIIYVLGAKGFCATGCPYGAIFAVADRFAPLRIRVTDDCTQSGHCTAVCSSNVRVHEEVRDFRMVVDPGCMKCLDCVSVCPNHALFVGWRKPAMSTASALPAARAASTRSRADAAPDRPASTRAAGLAMWVFLAAFALLALLVFHGFDLPYRFRPHPVGIVQCALLALIALAVLLAFRAVRHTPRTCSVPEELLLALFFLVSMVLVRGELVPFLFSLGLSAVTAYVLTQACLLLGRRQLSFQGWRLKHAGAFQPAAAGFGLVVAGVLGMWTYAGVAQAATIQTRDREAKLAELMPRVAHEPVDVDALDQAIRINRELATRRPDGARLLAWGRILCRHGRFDDVVELSRETMNRRPTDPVPPFLLGIIETLRPSPGSDERALRGFETAARLAPGWAEARSTLAQAYLIDGRTTDAIRELSAAVAAQPDDAQLRFALGSLLVQSGQIAAGRAEITRALELAPQRDDIRQVLATLPAP